MGVIMGAFSIASVLGVPLGLLVADFWGWSSTFIFIALFSLLIFALSFMLPLFPANNRKSDFAVILKNYFSLLKKGNYAFSYLMIFLVAISMFVLIPFLSPYAVKNIGIQATDLKYMYLVGGLCTVFTAKWIGKMTDRFGARKVFAYVAISSIVPVVLFTNAGPMPLYLYIMMSTLFMTIVSGRMIPCMTLISEVPVGKERGSFMGLLNSIRSLGAATATLLAGFVISETSRGELEHFDRVGYISVVVVIITIAIAYRLRLHNENLT